MRTPTIDRTKLRAAAIGARWTSQRLAERLFGISAKTIRGEMDRLHLPRRRVGNYSKAEYDSLPPLYP